MRENNALKFPPKRILVPLDLSEASTAAWKQAKALAGPWGAKVEGLYVQEWLHSAMGLGGGEPYLTAQAGRAALKSLRLRLGPGADVRSVSGSVEETILSWGKYLGFDLIVMGTHGRSGLERAIKGSIAETILRHSSIPVLALRKSAPRFRRVLVPVNFQPYSLGSLLFAAKVAAALGARLKVLHVLSAPLYADESAMKAPRELLEEAVESLPARLRHACRPQTLLAFGKPADEIVRAAAEADLVVLVAHRKGLLSDAFLGTTAERVLRYCPKPVLAVPMRKASAPKEEAHGAHRHPAARS